jgi:hypothetical protein
MNHSQVVQASISHCLTKKRNGVDGYNLMLPVSEEHSCYGQVVNAATGEHYKSKSSFPMELLFRDAPGVGAHFEIDPTRPGNCQRFKGDKATFAKEIVPALPPAAFEPARPVFDFILQTIGQ